MSDLISVIIPVYNVEKYIEKSVKSVLNQTYKNLEIILVDDGSKDSSGKLCDELAKIDSRVKVIHKENGGLSSARNVGMKYVTGNYIAFLDSDDVIISNFYEYLYTILKRYDADISEGEFLRIPEDSIDDVENILNEKNRSEEVREELQTSKESINIIYGVRETPYVKKVVVWNKLYKKEVLENIIFPEGKLHEDECTTHKILYNAKRIVSSNRYLHGYIQSKSSIMRKEISIKRVEDNLSASIGAMNFFETNGYTEIIPKIMIRYLSNCIELYGKIEKEETADKEQKLEVIKNYFIEFYKKNINTIKEKCDEELEIKMIEVIEDTYKGFDFTTAWKRVQELIYL